MAHQARGAMSFTITYAPIIKAEAIYFDLPPETSLSLM